MAKFPTTLLVTEGEESGTKYYQVEGSSTDDLSLHDLNSGDELAIYQFVETRKLNIQLALNPTNGRKKPKNGRRKPKNGRRKKRT